MNILFIGVGKMGLPMAIHLKNLGHIVTVLDINEQQLTLAKESQLTTATTSDYQSADWIISSMPNDKAFLEVAKNISVQAKEGSRYIDTSTISLSASSTAAKWLEEKQIPYLRVAVSGNNHMAQLAQLTVLASGPEELFQKAKPLLSSWGSKIYYLGTQEQSRLMKLVVNLMIAQTSAMLAEALTLGRLGSLDWEMMWEVVTNSAVGSGIMKAKSVQLGQALGSRDFTPTFTVHQMIKDLTLITAAADDLGAPIEQTRATLDWMNQAVEEGDGNLDYAAIIRVLERAVGMSTQ
jgi:3-hydroxyisobutyrate dehydrogenase